MNPPGREWAFELADATKEYAGGVRALAGVSLRLAPGRLAALVGPNGSGKTTALKLLAGLARPDRGAAWIAGRPAGSPAARSRIGYLPAAPRYPGGLTGREFLHYLGRLSGLRGAALAVAVARRAGWAGLAGLLDRPIRSYSTGQRQHLGLAQALLHEPDLLLLDEPAAGLDPLGVARLADLLQALRAEGRTVLFSSHFLAQVEALCDDAWLLGGGRLLWAGDPRSTGSLTEKYLELAPAHVAGS